MIADMHAHPFLCPFQQRKYETDSMSTDPNKETSVWHYYQNSNTIVDTLGYKFGFTTYSESDFTRSALHGVRLLNVSIYPPERGFFTLDTKTFVERVLRWFHLEHPVEIELGYIISGFSKANISHIKSDNYNYFTELTEQLGFVINAASYGPDPNDCVGSLYSNIRDAKYVLLKNGEVKNYLTEKIIQIVLSVEGGNALWGLFTDNKGNLWNGSNFNDHISDAILHNYTALLNNDFRNKITKDQVENSPETLEQLWPQEVCDNLLVNLRTLLKNYSIFSYTFAHHFYNGLCGHCASLQPLTDHKLVDQSFGQGTDITHLGYQVLNELLKNNVIVDVKHMSWKARQSFYRYRFNNYPQVPIIASHAAVNGYKDLNDMNSHDALFKPFYPCELNLFNDDIYEIVRSKGMIDVLFDQRVNGAQRSSLNTFWRQFTYIAEIAAQTANNPNETAWDNICIGTDFDGVIHPLDEYKTYECMEDFYSCLLEKITEYMKNPPVVLREQDRLSPLNIVTKICYTNMSDFVQKHS